MSADHAAVTLIVLTAIPSTIFAFLYGLTTKWWRNGFLGYALMFSSAGLSSLVIIALLYNWLGDDYYLRDVVRLSVYTLICMGAWAKLIAYFAERTSRAIQTEQDMKATHRDSGEDGSPDTTASSRF